MMGIDNTVADWLTFERDKGVEKFLGVKFHPLAYDYPSKDTLSNHFLSFFPQDIPKHFRISHLPPTILLFMLQAAQILSLSVSQKEKKVTNKLTKLGNDGASLSKVPSSTTTPLLTEYHQMKSCSSPRFSLSFSKNATFLSQEKLLGDIQLRWQERLSKKNFFSLAATFRDRFGWSLVHRTNEGPKTLWNNLRDLFQAMDNLSTKVEQQRVITPKFLQHMVSFLLRLSSIFQEIVLPILLLLRSSLPCNCKNLPRPQKRVNENDTFRGNKILLKRPQRDCS